MSDLLESEMLHALSSCASCAELSEFNRMLIRASTQIEDRLAQTIQGNDEDLARQLQEQMNQENYKIFDEDERLLQEFLRRDRTCEFCQTEFPAETPPHVLLTCEHHLCQNCALQEIIARKSPEKQSDYVCPISKCDKTLTEVDIRALLPLNEVERYIDAALNDLGSSVVKCPTGCGWAVTVDLSGTVTKASTVPNQSETGIDGKPLTIDARRHRDRYRIRCRRCPDTDFCAECLATPYHLGFTCADHEHFKKQRHCRFCGAQVPNDAPWIANIVVKGNQKDLESVLRARFVTFKPKSKLDILKKAIEDSEPLADVCGSEECQQWAKEGCGKVLACRHVCLGIRDEAKCLGCLQCDTGDGAPARADDFCNICWTTDLKGAPCLRLDCGHVFHQHCLVHKVESRWCGARITFGFLDCPLCKQPLAASALASILAPHLALRKVVMARAEQRLALEGGHTTAPELAPEGRYHGQPVQYAMHKFAYYMCSRCSQPYFGGRRSCEVAAGEGEAAAFDASEMVCGGCSAQGKATCDQHGLEAIEYKCKFCCAVASWFCWGTTHFCDDCHRKQGTADSMSKKPRNQLPTCTPASCPLGLIHPPNGEEFVLGCQLCRSASAV